MIKSKGYEMEKQKSKNIQHPFYVDLILFLNLLKNVEVLENIVFNALYGKYISNHIITFENLIFMKFRAKMFGFLKY